MALEDASGLRAAKDVPILGLLSHYSLEAKLGIGLVEPLSWVVHVGQR